MRLNRFPKMVAVQYIRAKKLGYDEDKAKAFAYAEALKYAIFKNRRGSRGSTNTKRGHGSSGQKYTIHTQYDPIFKITVNENGEPVISNKTIKPSEFDEYFETKFNQCVKDVLLEWANRRLADVDKHILENENKFFNVVWKKIRDEDPFKILEG